MEFLTELLGNGYSWYSFSFLIFAFIVLKFGAPVVARILDTRIAQIRDDLKEAESLRVEAQEMLAQYQRKHRDAVQEAEKILETARDNAAQFRAKAEADLREVMERREAQLEERLKRMEQNAINEIRSYAADLAMNTASQIIIEKLDKEVGARLVEQSMVNIETNIQ